MTSRAWTLAGHATVVLGVCLLAVFLMSVRGTNAEKRHDGDRDHRVREGAGTLLVNCTLANPYNTPYTCRGDLVGKATLTDVNHFGDPLGADGSGGGCRLSSSTDTLTARDGSTLTFSTHGIVCFEATPGFAVRHNAYLIEGGTGRFAGAVGAGTFTVGSENPAIASIHIAGTISVPGH
ncbi:MAG: hypothetical protein KGN76_01155 [Acidobacteriota bacterium]|nr:hypothetical protein [Acidobacteriota bacterium]